MTPSAIPGMRKIVISDGVTNKTIEFRNVGEVNPDAQIQFIIQEYRIVSNRTTSVSFSIPAAAVDYFIEGITKAI